MENIAVPFAAGSFSIELPEVIPTGRCDPGAIVYSIGTVSDGNGDDDVSVTLTDRTIALPTTTTNAAFTYTFIYTATTTDDEFSGEVVQSATYTVTVDKDCDAAADITSSFDEAMIVDHPFDAGKTMTPTYTFINNCDEDNADHGNGA